MKLEDFSIDKLLCCYKNYLHMQPSILLHAVNLALVAFDSKAISKIIERKQVNY